MLTTERPLNTALEAETLSLQRFLRLLREEMNAKDPCLMTDESKVGYLLSRKAEVFKALDRFFDRLWDLVTALPPEEFARHKAYMEQQLLPYFSDGVEMNAYIRSKPLGYAGDYVMMNYIYEYNGEGKFFGRDLYAMMLNHYTCNVDVASSNIQRKEYLKKKIIESVCVRKDAEILSVGCGPAREWIELLKEKKIVGPVKVHLLDLEKNAIEFVRQELAKIDYDRSRISINFHMLDLIEIVKNRKMAEAFQNVDLVYVSGVFDYLNDKISQRVIKGLLAITGKELVIFNMSEENDRHRAYYETLGEWVMFHRRREQVLGWVEPFKGELTARIEDFPACKSYWILDLRKK
jgi:extracellular factor (EF) 3-hydroxypalmitic acid methyl ester biosynthesis protein